LFRTIDWALDTNQNGPGRRDRDKMMSNTTVLSVDMAILVGIFLLGLLAKLFPRNGGKAGNRE
jgi:hypothetical protein